MSQTLSRVGHWISSRCFYTQHYSKITPAQPTADFRPATGTSAGESRQISWGVCHIFIGAHDVEVATLEDAATVPAEVPLRIVADDIPAADCDCLSEAGDAVGKEEQFPTRTSLNESRTINFSRTSVESSKVAASVPLSRLRLDWDRL